MLTSRFTRPLRLRLAKAGPIEDIIDDVNGLVSANMLNSGLGQSLLTKLEAAITKVNQGNCIAAKNQLKALINEVMSLIEEGQMPSAAGQDIINAAQSVLDSLPC